MTARQVNKVRHFILTVATCAFALSMANVVTWLVPRRFGLAGSELGSAPSWFTGRLLDLPAGLAVSLWLVTVLVGFAWRRHTGYSRGVLAWAVAATLCVMVSIMVGSMVHSIPTGVLWFVLDDVLLVTGTSTGAFALAGIAGVLLAQMSTLR